MHPYYENHPKECRQDNKKSKSAAFKYLPLHNHLAYYGRKRGFFELDF
jgi:hypothetical protein